MTNLIPSPEDLTTDWTNVGCVLVADALVAPDGETTLDTAEDNAAGAYEYFNETGSYTTNTLMTLSVYIPKDAIAAATRFPMVRLRFSGGTLRNVDLKIDTSDGSSTHAETTGTMVETIEVIDAGDYWRARITADDDNMSNTTWLVECYPAAGANADLTTLSATATGTTGFWGFLLEEGGVLNDYFSGSTDRLAFSPTRNVTRNVTRGVTEDF